MDRRLARALGWQIALAVYMQAISWVPLGRWNYQPCCPPGLEQLRRGNLSVVDALGTAAFVLPCLVFWLGAHRRVRWLMGLGVLPLIVWLGLQFWSWWPPYIVGASDRWARVYARAFAQATQVLPRWGTHLPPDAMHLVLQLLLSGAVLTGATAVLHATESARVPARAP